MKIRPFALCLAAAGALLSPQANAIPVPGLFNTGVDDSGNVLPIDSADLHYALTGPVSGAKVSTRFVGGANQWVIAPAGSAWICPNTTASSPPVGLYTYALHIDLSGFDPAAISITGQLASDNEAHIFLNGIDTGFANLGSQYSAMQPFTVSGFLSGLNTLEFTVANNPTTGSNPTGLLIANLVAVPEPSGCAFLATGALALFISQYRNRSRGAGNQPGPRTKSNFP